MEILEIARDISRRHEALSNEIRVLILAVIMSSKEAKWIDIRDMLEKILNRRVNPNLLAFHLRRLMENGLVEKKLDTYNVNIASDMKRELENLILKIREMNRE